MIEELKKQTMLESKDAFILAEHYTATDNNNINSFWLQNNGYIRKRMQIDNVRKTYYIKENETDTI